MTLSKCVFLSNTRSIRNSSINRRIKEEQIEQEGLLYLLSLLSLCFSLFIDLMLASSITMRSIQVRIYFGTIQ